MQRRVSWSRVSRSLTRFSWQSEVSILDALLTPEALRGGGHSLHASNFSLCCRRLPRAIGHSWLHSAAVRQGSSAPPCQNCPATCHCESLPDFPMGRDLVFDSCASHAKGRKCVTQTRRDITKTARRNQPFLHLNAFSPLLPSESEAGIFKMADQPPAAEPSKSALKKGEHLIDGGPPHERLTLLNCH